MDASIKIVAFRIAAYDDAEGKGANSVFFLDVGIRRILMSRKKLTKFVPFLSAPSYAAIRKATILTPPSVVYQ